ncbi:MAG: hypothetical protein V1899_04750 [Planctomycetota bacterium]
MASDDQNNDVRSSVAHALGNVGGEKARTALLKQLIAEKDRDALKNIYNVLKERFAGDPTVEKALKDFNLPEPSKPQSQQPQLPPDDF